MNDLPPLTEEERVRVIEQGTASAFWVRVLLPYLIEKAATTTRSLVAGKSEDDDIKRGMARAYEDIAKMPAREVQAFALEQQRQQELAEREKADSFRATFGFRAPFRPADDREEAIT